MISTMPGPTAEQIAVTFTVRPHEHLDGSEQRGVSVVGDFNDWNPYATPLTPGPDGALEGTAVLRMGNRYAFRYLADGGQWFNDPESRQEPNDMGSENSVLDLDAPSE